MAISDAEYRVLKEKVEVLNGDRGDKDRSMAALRRRDLRALQELSAGNAKAITQAGVEQQQSSATLTDLRQRMSAAEERLVALSAASEALGTRTGDLEAELQAVSDRLAAAEQQGVQQADEIAAIQLDLAAVEQGIADMTARVKAVTVPALKAKAVTAAPTADQYNDLLADVTAVRKAVLDIKAAIAP